MTVGWFACFSTPQAYFITNKHPLPFWDFMTRLNLGLGYGQPWLPLPFGLMLAVGKLCDQLEVCVQCIQIQL